MNQPRLRVNMISETTFTVRGHGVHTAFVEMTNGLRKLPQVDVVVNKFRKADITHIQTVGPYSALHLVFGRGKKVISVHVIPDSFIGPIRGAARFANVSRAYLHWFYGKADILLPVSEETGKALGTQLGLKTRSEVLFNTVDRSEYAVTKEEKAAAKTKLGIKPEQFLVVANGQVQPRKRFDSFVAIAKQLPDMQFIWVGGIPFKRLGADFEHMQQLISGAPTNVKVTGVIELADVKQYYSAADTFILPSDQENHPLAILEAAASGLPVIVRDIPEYDSAFGQNVLRGADSSFVNIIERLATDKAYYREAVASAGKIAERFDSPVAAHHLYEIYLQLVEEAK